ncbi:MAG: hypothetical protein Q9201_001053 [Fulgogasparrea decipioides]
MDGGAMETKRPLTPPADFMDIEMGLQGGALSNGHHLKDSSPNTAPPTGNSTQATSLDESESADFNGVDAAVLKANHFASEANADLSITAAGDEPSVASSGQAQDHTIDQREEGTNNVTPDLTSFPPQQPTSALREEPQPVSSEQPSKTEVQESKEVNAPGPDLVNGSLSDHPQSIEEPTETESQAPVQSAVDPAPQLITSQASDPANSQPSITTADVPHHPPVPLPDGQLPEEPLDPAPSPIHLVDGSTEAPNPDPMSVDEQAPTMPQSPTKLSRPREEDGDEGPAAKRSKVDDGPSPDTAGSVNSDFKVPAQPGTEDVPNLSVTTQTPSEPSKPITPAQKKHIIKTIQNTRRSLDAAPFAKPVDVVALSIPTYPDIIKNPMDLTTLEEKLKNYEYSSLEAFRSDFDLILQNAITFNGPEHFLIPKGRMMVKIFERGMANLPGPEVEAPASGNKKARKTSLPSAAKVGPSRRESRTSLPAPTVPSPITTQSPTTFALNPQGIPLIRRDSTKGDGRPKREIHPPAPRDLPYANSKPKKKKYQAELKFCLHVLNELAKPRYKDLTVPFAIPVDPVALNIPDYHSVIKKPMDLRTVREKLEGGQYENAKEFEADIRLMFANCHKYNGVDHPIRTSAKTLEGFFDQEMAHKRSWIEANSPVSGAQSTTSSDADDDEEEEEEDEAEEAADLDQLSKLQRSIAEMSRQVELLKAKKNTPPATSKKTSKGGKSDKKTTKKGATAPAAKAEKKAPAKHSKKEQYVTYEQKQDISNRINSLSETKMAKALKIIRDNMPGLKGVQDDELELDIDELSDDVLRKLWDFVKKNSKPQEEVRAPPVVSTAPAPSRKKNKPMSKQEQERQIQDLKQISSQFQNPTPSIESAPQTYAVHAESSSDESASEESEEE